MKYQHQPVMLAEVLKFLQPRAGEKYLDATLGGAGYAVALATAVGESGQVVAFDADPLAIANAESLVAEQGLGNLALINENFGRLTEGLAVAGLLDTKFDGIVFDLGLSSAQLDDRERGFSFQIDGPLDMSLVPASAGVNKTQALLNKNSAEDIARILRDYGEERYAWPIAKAITAARKVEDIKTTLRLVEIIASAVPAAYRRDRRLHFATRTFQALRIATNDELAMLRQALNQLPQILVTGGKLVVVAFHSLEDRIVKSFLARESKNCLCPPAFPICICGHRAGWEIVTKRAVTATDAEIERNPRARSAKLRAASLK